MFYILYIFQISEEGITKTNNTIHDDAFLLTISEVVIELPDPPVKIDGDIRGEAGKAMGGFSIVLSNDRVKYSNDEALFLTYDGKCIECTKTGNRTCYQKVIYLVFEGNCK